jgi:hypothetical protein
MKTTSPKEQQKQVDEFNRKCQLGQHVNVRLDNGEVKTTTTRSEAQLMGGHTAVVWLEGINGAYLLDRVTVLPRVGADA